jgi:ATP-dependent Clp protease adaptor protein ClpS
MPTNTAEAAAQQQGAEPAPRTERKVGERTKRKRQPPYVVILHNDDLNTFEHVVGVLRKVFNYDRPRAIQLTLEAHTTGQCIVWSGTLELAELKADQIRSCGPDPEMKVRGALALRVTVEPLPG